MYSSISSPPSYFKNLKIIVLVYLTNYQHLNLQVHVCACREEQHHPLLHLVPAMDEILALSATSASISPPLSKMSRKCEERHFGTYRMGSPAMSLTFS